MKLSSFIPYPQVMWYIDEIPCKPLAQDISTEVLVIGGGMAGLSAAQAFRAKGHSVVLLEKNYCGSGASGKSSGFITPNSELSLQDLINTHGIEGAKKLWEFATMGVEHIRNNITTYDIDCDYQKQDTLVLASSEKAFNNDLTEEFKARSRFNYPSNLYAKDELHTVIGSTAYHGGISYPDTFSIRAYHYCQAMKKILLEQGVTIYEETPVIDIQNNIVKTQHHTIKAQRIIVCMDHYARNLPALNDKVYHVQTLLMASAPLAESTVNHIFPHHRYQVWDTELIYHYFRLTGDNRLLIGGASLFDTYANQESYNNKRTMALLTKYINSKFPGIDIAFEYAWPGLIGISKDIFPLAGFDATMPSVYYITAATGLPWAAALGIHSADHILNNNTSFDAYFSPYRSFTLGPTIQKILGTKLTYALSHFLTAGSI